MNCTKPTGVVWRAQRPRERLEASLRCNCLVCHSHATELAQRLVVDDSNQRELAEYE